MAEILLTNTGAICTVDDEDLEMLSQYVWWDHESEATPTCRYVYGVKLPHIPKQDVVVKMHRVVLGVADPSKIIDHIDGNGHNNRKSNLQFVTRAQNSQKANVDPDRNPRKVHSRYRGVSYLGWHGRYLAYVNCNGKREYLGYFDTDVEAAKARDARAKELHGKFARLNFENS